MVTDCQKWEHEMIPNGNDFTEFEVIVVYSVITKNLISTDLNNRVVEVRVAGWMLQEIEGMPLSKLDDVMLRDIPREVFEKNKDRLLERFRKRVAHFYTEKDRVEKRCCGMGEWRYRSLWSIDV